MDDGDRDIIWIAVAAGTLYFLARSQGINLSLNSPTRGVRRFGRHQIPASELGPALGPILPVRRRFRGLPLSAQQQKGSPETGSDAFGREHDIAAAQAEASLADPSRATFNGPVARAIAGFLGNIAAKVATGGVFGKVLMGIVSLTKNIPVQPTAAAAGAEAGAEAGPLSAHDTLQANWDAALGGLTQAQRDALGFSGVDPSSLSPGDLSLAAQGIQAGIETNINATEADLAARGFDPGSPSASPDPTNNLSETGAASPNANGDNADAGAGTGGGDVGVGGGGGGGGDAAGGGDVGVGGY